MRNFSFLLKICFAAIIFFSGCKKKCDQTEIADLRFTTEDFNINPYTENESLTFKDLTGDSIFFNRGTRETSSFTYYQITDDYLIEENNGCRGNYFTLERDNTDFHSNTTANYLSEIQIELGYNFSFSDQTPSKYIYFGIYDNQSNTDFLEACHFTNDSLFNSGNDNSIYAYHNQISIGPRTFSNIYELHGNNHGNNSEYFTTAYYSITKGFCGFKTNLGKTIYLDKTVSWGK
jgi:hypothetical protein